MAFDFYRKWLAHAKWTWREGQHSRWHNPFRRKDRVSGRNEKRKARQLEQRDIKEEL